MTLQDAIKSGRRIREPSVKNGNWFYPCEDMSFYVSEIGLDTWEVEPEINQEGKMRNQNEPMKCYVFEDVLWKNGTSLDIGGTIVFPSGDIPLSILGKRGKLIFIENE